ncbi:Piwi-domain-containing protein [Trametes cingulata]|nr:Piwi-domain-containing protein [Trametes cingulata]
MAQRGELRARDEREPRRSSVRVLRGGQVREREAPGGDLARYDRDLAPTRTPRPLLKQRDASDASSLSSSTLARAAAPAATSDASLPLVLPRPPLRYPHPAPPPSTSVPSRSSDMNPQAIEVWTNSFEITTLPTARYFHYDGIQPEVLIKRMNYQIIDRLQLDQAAIFHQRAAYDGRKNLFCTGEIQSGSFTVQLGRKPFTVVIKRVGVISPTDVHRLTRKRNPNDPNDNAMCLNLLQLIVRQAPNMRHNFPADARSFYIAHQAKDLRVGLSACRGIFQYTPGRLIDSMLAHLELSDVRALQNLPHAQHNQLRSFLKGVLIRVTLTKMRPRPISDLVANAGMQDFDKDGERWTVARHFQNKYNVQVRYPNIVGVRVGRSAIIPAEFCEVVPGQVYRKKLSPRTQADFLNFTKQKPEQRLDMIRAAVSGPTQLLDYATSDFMKDAGMKVNTSPMSIRGVLIPPPQIRYGNANEVIRFKSGAWNVLGKRFVQPATLRNWGVAVFDSHAQLPDVQAFISTLVGNLQRLEVVNRYPPILNGNQQNPVPTLENVGTAILNGPEKGRPEMVIVILPASAADCRREVKHWGDCQRKVSTQCVRSPKWKGANDQYCNNVALKINARLGGTNSVLDTEAAAFLQTCMVVGADVGHPGPGVTTRPSVTGLVASVDPMISKMTSFVNVQRPRQEIIADLEEMMRNALRDYYQYHRRLQVAENLRQQRPKPEDELPPPPPPKNIVFYRDGVSEGEFAQVAAMEIPMIKRAFATANIPPEHRPRLLFIVVGKRYVLLLFSSPQESDKSGNCPAGLLVDQHITNPNYPDFYLQSHAGILGTSRPSHYVILENETGLNPMQVQTLTFHLCHSYASATRSVSIPAPRACARMEFHCANGQALSDTASNVTGGEQEFDLEQWRRIFQESGLSRRMYFL